jgi:hypothetical protein
MRALGIWLLGFGIVLLIMDGVALASVNTLEEVVGFLVCGALVPVPMIAGGIALVRRAEERERPGTPEPPRVPSAGRPQALRYEYRGDWLQRVRTFDLTRLNWVGWLLLLATFAFVLAEAGLLVLLLGDWGNRPAAKVVAVPMLLLALAFFFGVRWLLGKLGVTIYRR